jgi:two-component system C4-dicarboxylate transport response regulator DctD
MSPILKVLLVEDDPEVLLGTKQHAHGGTLFLDEIESMPPAMQVKLLRVLQERKIERLGSNDPVTIDFRVIAASKPNLIELVEKGQFRQDLFYRLNVAVIDLPPLRERKEDIPLLFEHFVLDAARRHQRPAPVVTERQLSEFLSHDWPGNVRELRNVADRFVLGLLDDSVSIRSPRCQESLFERTDRSIRASPHRGRPRRASGKCGAGEPLLGNSEMNALRQDSKVRAVN